MAFWGREKLRSRLWAFVLLFLLTHAALGAAPEGSGEYRQASPGLVDLVPGAIVEGSAKYGGLQPDYLLDPSHPNLKPLMDFSASLAQTPMEFWGKVELIQNYIKNFVLVERSYTTPAYLNLMAKYRRLNKPVPIGEYAAIRAGVCREHALITHFALKAAGIENFYGYYQVEQNGHVEDHAFSVVKYRGEARVIDTYNANFNGYRLEALLRGNRLGASKLEWELSETRRRIVALKPYPRFWIPKGTKMRPACKALMRVFRGWGAFDKPRS